ncbi:hypothetical protein ACWD5F_09930 [Streptomyces sp. NPDC002499]
MSSFSSQTVIAVLGISGTLAAALLTQRSANRARERRTCCTTLNADTRDLANVMTKALHALERSEATEDLRSDLDRARRDHRLRHAEAQMMLPDPVMATASTANRHLGDLYGLLMRLDRGSAEQGQNLETARESMNALWDALRTMRHVMRVDLGITAPAQDP